MKRNMNVKLLGMTGTDLLHYSSEPEKAIIHIMTYGTPTLVMEPGELADFAQGHKLLTNSNAEIVILNEEDSYLAPEGGLLPHLLTGKSKKQCGIRR